MKKQVSISSFNHDCMNELEGMEIEFGYLFNKEEPSFPINTKACTINLFYKDVSAEIVERAHKKGIGVLAYFPMSRDDTDEEYVRLFECGVDVICTNDPKRVMMLRDKFFYN